MVVKYLVAIGNIGQCRFYGPFDDLTMANTFAWAACKGVEWCALPLYSETDREAELKWEVADGLEHAEQIDLPFGKGK